MCTFNERNGVCDKKYSKNNIARVHNNVEKTDAFGRKFLVCVDCGMFSVRFSDMVKIAHDELDLSTA